MKGHVIAELLAKNFVVRQANEANTRHQIVDRLLHEVLAWPHESVGCEEKVHPGYIDYTLHDKAGRAVLLIEAKKEEKYFLLPTKFGANHSLRYVRLKTLATDANIAAAVHQAAKYCPEIGCQYACVTNGHEFVIFRSFIPGRHYLDADALVIPKLEYFAEHFTEAYNLFGYEAVTSDRSLHYAFTRQKAVARDLYYPKSGITHYDATVQQNQYARFVDPIARRYFGEIKATDRRMMDHCYVFARGAKQVEAGLKTRLADDLTAYFRADGAQNISETRTGGKLTERIARSLKSQSSGEVLILYGGKGAGKFIYADEIRITAFGIYMLDYLSGTFTYLDLVSLDCGLTEEKLYHSFCRAASQERNLGTTGEKKARLESRLKRTAAFVNYLRLEETREKGEFLLSETEEIVPKIQRSFEEDRERALQSAKKNIGR